MKKSRLVKILGLSVVVLAMVFASPAISLSDQGAPYSPAGSGNVVVIVQSGDYEMIFHAFQFCERAIVHQWMDNVKIVLWGPAEKTIAGLQPDNEIMVLIKKIQSYPGKHSRILACKACSDRYGITDKLFKLGFEVVHVGDITSLYIKSGYRIWNW
jgi:hypothetical protein